MGKTHNLKPDWDNSEVQNLHGGPEDEVGLEGRQVDVLKLAHQRPPASSLSDGHEGEEGKQSYGL